MPRGCKDKSSQTRQYNQRYLKGIFSLLKNSLFYIALPKKDFLSLMNRTQNLNLISCSNKLNERDRPNNAKHFKNILSCISTVSQHRQSFPNVCQSKRPESVCLLADDEQSVRLTVCCYLICFSHVITCVLFNNENVK